MGIKSTIKKVAGKGADAVAKMQTKDFVDGAVVLNIPITLHNSLLNLT